MTAFARESAEGANGDARAAERTPAVCATVPRIRRREIRRAPTPEPCLDALACIPATTSACATSSINGYARADRADVSHERPGAPPGRSHDFGSRPFGETNAVWNSDALVGIADHVEPAQIPEARLNVRHAIEVTDERLRARVDVTQDPPAERPP